MTVQEFLDLFYKEYRETSSNTAFNDEDLLRQWMHEGYMTACDDVNWSEMNCERTITLTKTALASDSSAGSTTITVDDASGFIVGLTLCLYSGSIYEQAKISAINFTTNVITLESALVNAFDEDDNVYFTNFFIPVNDEIKGIKWYQYDATTKMCKPLEGIRTQDFDYDYDLIQTSGTPEKYAYTDYDSSIVISGTASTGTNTTQVRVASTLGFEDDYLNDCLLVNTTRSSTSRIRDYDESGRYIYLQDPITGQVSTDTFVIYRNQQIVSLYPIPNVNGKIKIKYKRVANKLVNDYDFPLFNEKYHKMILWYMLYKASLLDHDQLKLTNYLQVYSIDAQKAIKYAESHKDITYHLDFGS